MGNDPRKGTREIWSSRDPPVITFNRSTLQKVRIVSEFPARRAWRMDRVRAWWAGELIGSGKVSFHNPMVRVRGSKLTLAKRCFRARWIHDLETRQ